VIVLCAEGDEQGSTVVTVMPITHRRPENPDWAVEIPAAVRVHLELDNATCWIVVAEGNKFLWPGYDLRQRPNGSYTFGFLPPRLFKRVQAGFIAVHQAAKAQTTLRD
jgi:hypothetical protein